MDIGEERRVKIFLGDDVCQLCFVIIMSDTDNGISTVNQWAVLFFLAYRIKTN